MSVLNSYIQTWPFGPKLPHYISENMIHHQRIQHTLYVVEPKSK